MEVIYYARNYIPLLIQFIMPRSEGDLMSEDLTKNLPTGNAEILSAIKSLDGRFSQLEGKFDRLDERVEKDFRTLEPSGRQ